MLLAGLSTTRPPASASAAISSSANQIAWASARRGPSSPAARMYSICEPPCAPRWVREAITSGRDSYMWVSTGRSCRSESSAMPASSSGEDMIALVGPSAHEKRSRSRPTRSICRATVSSGLSLPATPIGEPR